MISILDDAIFYETVDKRSESETTTEKQFFLMRCNTKLHRKQMLYVRLLRIDVS